MNVRGAVGDEGESVRPAGARGVKTNGVEKVKAGAEKAAVLDGEAKANVELWLGGAIDGPGVGAVGARGGTRGAEANGVVDEVSNAKVGKAVLDAGSIVKDVGSEALLAESLPWLMLRIDVFFLAVLRAWRKIPSLARAADLDAESRPT